MTEISSRDWSKSSVPLELDERDLRRAAREERHDMHPVAAPRRVAEIRAQGDVHRPRLLGLGHIHEVW